MAVNQRQKTEGVNKNGQSTDTGKIGHIGHTTSKHQRKPKEQSRIDKPETLPTLGTQNTGEINIRESRKNNLEWTSQRHYQHWAHKTQEK